MGFLALIGSLVALWAAIQVLGVRSREDRQEQCRILDIQLKEDNFSAKNRQFCRVMIHLDQKVSYKITEPEKGSALLVELPHATVSGDLESENLSNDLVKNIWIKHLDSGPLTVGFDLASSRILVVDRTKKSPGGANLIELELKQKGALTDVASLAKAGSPRLSESGSLDRVSPAVSGYSSPREGEIVLVSERTHLIP